jgi:hypothetical protein
MSDQPVNLSQYKLKKSMDDEHIGSIQILKNDNNQFVMKKELSQLNLSKYYSLIQSKLRQLNSVHFQRTLECSPVLKDTLVFEFSKKNLEHHLQICKEKEQFVSEEDLFALLTALLECGKQMEANNEYHPALSLQNIFRVKDHFKLVNPYLFDSYMIETINVFYFYSRNSGRRRRPNETRSKTSSTRAESCGTRARTKS